LEYSSNQRNRAGFLVWWDPQVRGLLLPTGGRCEFSFEFAPAHLQEDRLAGRGGVGHFTGEQLSEELRGLAGFGLVAGGPQAGHSEGHFILQKSVPGQSGSSANFADQARQQFFRSPMIEACGQGIHLYHFVAEGLGMKAQRSKGGGILRDPGDLAGIQCDGGWREKLLRGNRPGGT
jgi:hypothetical protein